MRSALPLALLLGCLTSSAGLARASDRADESCVDSYRSDLREHVSPPEQPGPHRCVMVPATKEIKRTVYATKWVPYCLPKPSCPDCRRDDCRRPCPECEKCVRWKKVVVKREVVVDVVRTDKCVPKPCRPTHTAIPAPADGLPPAPAGAPPASRF